MIQKLSIRNFKSIRELDLDCRRVNVFIGEPNAGKTNVLEALGLCCKQVRKRMAASLRVSQAADLFWDQSPLNEINISLDEFGFNLAKSGNNLRATSLPGKKGFTARWNDSFAQGEDSGANLCKYYLFAEVPDQWSTGEQSLEPPFGENIASLLYADKNARKSAGRFFAGSGLRLTVDFSARRLKLVKEEDDVLVAFPYSSASETLRRMVFYHLALETNSNQVLVFDEPEAHSFPPYTKTLAERIALDNRGNQFFLTTHSPYMLDSLLSKTPADDLNVVLCRMENFETKAYPLNQEQIDQIKEWSMDAFFNFDRLLPEAG